MKGSVYCVLFTNGLVKVGFTAGEQHKRIRQHIAAGRAFGLYLDMFFFSEMHDGAELTEQALIKHVGKILKANTNEYFQGGDRFICRDAMLSTEKLVAWSDELAVIGDKVLVNPGINCLTPQKSQPNLENRIKKLVEKNSNITEGIIKNRFRTKNIQPVLDRMVSDGILKKEISTHKSNGSKIVMYKVID